MTKEKCVLLKLVTGETIIAMVEDDMIDTMVIHHPIQLKNVQVMKNGAMYEQTMTSEFCSFSEDDRYELNKNHIVYSSSIKKNFEVLYRKIVDQFYTDQEESEVSQANYVEEVNKNLH